MSGVIAGRRWAVSWVLLAGCGFVDGDPIVSGTTASLPSSSTTGSSGSTEPVPMGSSTSGGSLDGATVDTEASSSTEASSGTDDGGAPVACACERLGPGQRCIRLVNECERVVWAGLSGDDTTGPVSLDARLESGECVAVPVVGLASGRAFGRTDCVDDMCASDGNDGRGTLVQMVLSVDGADTYNVSLVDGFNLPMAMHPVVLSTGSECQAASCAADLNVVCPEGLARFDELGEIAYCTSACRACGECPGCNDCGAPVDPACDPCSALSDLCCTGQGCGPSEYTMLWKSLCPDATTYGGEGTAFSCDQRPGYDIVFCP